MTSLFVKIKGKLENLDIDFEHKFNSKGITVLFGPNGSGKSTILSAIAGFLDNFEISVISNGIQLEGNQKVPAYKRSIGIMFQDPTLFEHLTVEENLLFPLKRNKSKSSIKYNIVKEDIIFSLELDNLLKRYPANLSGGEKLRVALARTILTRPDYLLLDEPLSDLDIRYKAKILHFLKIFNQKYKIPILYITHSLEEISQISDNIVLINNGKLVQYGPTAEILNSHNFKNLIGKFESGSVLEGIVSEVNKSFFLTTLNIDGQSLIVPGNPGKIGDHVRVRIRSRDIIITSIVVNAFIAENALTGNIIKVETEKTTAFSELLIDLDSNNKSKKKQILRVRISTFNLEKMQLSKSKKVYIYIRAVSIDRQAYKRN